MSYFKYSCKAFSYKANKYVGSCCQEHAICHMSPHWHWTLCVTMETKPPKQMRQRWLLRLNN